MNLFKKYYEIVVCTGILTIALFIFATAPVISKTTTSNTKVNNRCPVRQCYFSPDQKKEVKISQKIIARYSAGSWHYSALKRVAVVRNKYGAIIESVAHKYNIDPEFVITVIMIESTGLQNQISSTGAEGLMQITTAPLKDMGIQKADLLEPKTNIQIGVAYLKRLRDHYGFQTHQAIAVAYNIGPTKARSMSEEAIKNHSYAKKVAFLLKHL